MIGTTDSAQSVVRWYLAGEFRSSQRAGKASSQVPSRTEASAIFPVTFPQKYFVEAVKAYAIHEKPAVCAQPSRNLASAGRPRRIPAIWLAVPAVVGRSRGPGP